MNRTIILTEGQIRQYFKYLKEQEGRTCYITQEQYDYIINEGIKQELAKQRKEVETEPTEGGRKLQKRTYIYQRF